MEKTLELLTDLSAKVTADGEASAKTYAEFYELCEDNARDLQFEIKTATANVESLEAAISKAASDIAVAETKIADLATSVASDTKDLNEATALREKEHKDFLVADKEMAETVDTLKRAIAILEDHVKGAAFVQNSSKITDALNLIVNSEFIQSADKAKVQALLQAQNGDSDEQPAGAPAAAVYETNEGTTSILQVLEDLLEKAEMAKDGSVKDEMTARHNFEMTEQKLKDSIAVEGAELSETKKSKAASEQAKANAEGDLAVTSKDKDTDAKNLKGLQERCMTTASEYEEEQKERQDELNALAEAKKILEEKAQEASGRAYKSFMQVQNHLRAKARLATKQPVNSKVMQRLQKLADETHETALLTLASRVKSAVALSDDPFAKVRGLISEMIEKLLADQAKEDSHKAWCDEETAETTAKKEDKEDIVSDLTGKIDKANARVAKLTDEVALLQSELGTIAINQKEMDKIRGEEKEQFAKAKKDYEDGVEGVTLALKVLREYYAQPEESFTQKDMNEAMSMVQQKKETDSATGIMGMLEVILSDFSKLLAEGQAGEDMAQTDYETQTQMNKLTTLTKSKDVEYKTKEKKELGKMLEESKEDLASTQTELDSINQYFASIQKSCVVKAEPYEERKRRREAELAGLKEALAILEGESLLQTSSFLGLARRHRS